MKLLVARFFLQTESAQKEPSPEEPRDGKKLIIDNIF